MHQKYRINIPYSTIIFFFAYFFFLTLIHYSNLHYLISVDWKRNDFDYPVAIQASVPSIFSALFELFCQNGYGV